jgi:prepilin-type processing-associated H-X9-DG protein
MYRVPNNLVWMLVALIVATPSLGLVEQSAKAAPPDEIERSYITPGAVVAVTAYPHRVLTSPEVEMYPIEILSAASKQELGIDPLDVAQLLAVIEPPDQGPPGYGIVFRLTKPYQLGALKLPQNLMVVDAQLEGRPYLRSENPLTPGFFMPDDQTLMVGSDAFLKKMLANHKNPVPGPLSRLVARANDLSDIVVVAVIEPIRPMVSGAMESAPLPPQFQSVKRLPELLDAAKVSLSVTGTPGASLSLLARSEEDAEELEGILTELLDLGQELALAQLSNELQGDDPIELAGARYAQRITRLMFDMFRPVRNGRVIQVSQKSAGSMQIATIGVLVAMLLPAIQAAREAARRMSSLNNLKQIAIAMLNHHDVYGTFPARAIFDDNGKPLLSWRVKILPFLDENALYQQFHLDEPWDSKHNKTLIDKMPAVYRNPSSAAAENLANYLVPTGAGSIFAGREGSAMTKITDGTSNTLLVLEVNDGASVIWTKPSELDYKTANPLAGLGTSHPGGFNAAMADGSVHFISASIDVAVFLRMLMMNDGQPTGF